MELDPSHVTKPSEPVAEKPSSRITYTAALLPPQFSASLETMLRRLDAMDASTRQTRTHLTGLKEDFRLLRRQAGQLVRFQGQEVASLESNIPK